MKKIHSVLVTSLLVFLFVSAAQAQPQTCLGTPVVFDYDGNEYVTIQIGNQCWMKENLRSEHYSDGTEILLSRGTSNTTEPLRFYPNNIQTYVSQFGYLYNWFAVMNNASSSTSNPSGVQGVCPTGWHVPSDAEFTQLTDYVGSQSQNLCSNNSTYIAKALASQNSWYQVYDYCAVGNNPAENNATGFSLLPAGNFFGIPVSFNISGILWSATAKNNSNAYVMSLECDLATVSRENTDKGVAFSVRCLRDSTGWTPTVVLPTVSSSQISNLTSSSVTCGGDISYDGEATITARGVCWSTSPNPTIEGDHIVEGAGTGEFVCDITGLNPGTTYYVRAYATNSRGTGYGEQITFTTPAVLPTVSSIVLNSMLSGVPNCSASVIADGGSPIATYGICWGIAPNPTIEGEHYTFDSDTVAFPCTITGLTPGTTYYIRAYATNSVGVGYGDQLVVTTQSLPVDNTPACPGTPTVTDYDGNVYHTVQIGNQCWMKENLRSKHYSDGTSILQELFDYDRPHAQYQYPGNDTNNVATYGYLYNWAALMNGAQSSNSVPSDVQGICPTGWHLPSDAEWTILNNYARSQNEFSCDSNSNYLGKAFASVTGWDISTASCAVGYDPYMNNAIGFNALPAGTDYTQDVGTMAAFWSCSNYSRYTAYGRYLFYRGAVFYQSSFYIESDALSVRCLKSDGGLETSALPKVSTYEELEATVATATCYGEVLSEGNSPVTARGFCWSTAHDPTISQNHITVGSGMWNFSGMLSGLSSNTTYYVRAYATNSQGTAYGEERQFSTTNPNDAQSCSGSSTVTDYEGNVYHTVQIGTQCWLKENMKAKHYSDGTAIEYGGLSVERLPCYYYPDNDSNNVSNYGCLYNWIAASRGTNSATTTIAGVQGVCPVGWHLPSKAEFEKLINYVGGQSAYRCDDDFYQISKALASTNGWNSSSRLCTVGNMPEQNNASGFSAMPSGYVYYDYNGFILDYEYEDYDEFDEEDYLDYDDINEETYFWTSTPSDEEQCWTLEIRSRYAELIENENDYGMSVRCISDETSTVLLPTVNTKSFERVMSNSASVTGCVLDDGGAAVTTRGFCWSTSPNPTLSDSHITFGSGAGDFSGVILGLSNETLYYVRAYATNLLGTAYGENLSIFTMSPIPAGDAVPCSETPTVVDYDGNIYHTVKIGTQCWMQENMRTTHFSDGTPIELGNVANSSRSIRYYPGGDSSLVASYGYLYNWTAAMNGSMSSNSYPSNVQGVCPIGWHLPSDMEWNVFSNYVRMHYEYQCEGIAKAVASNFGWHGVVGTCDVGDQLGYNNSTGFSVVPAGDFVMYNDGISYENCSYVAYLWSTMEYDNYDVKGRGISNGSTDMYELSISKYHGASARCLKNDAGYENVTLPQVTTSPISDVTNNTAICGGVVTQDGGGTVSARGVCWSTSPNPNLSNSYTLDGTGMGSFTSNISGLHANTTYYVRAYAVNSAGTAYGAQETFTTNCDPINVNISGTTTINFGQSTRLTASVSPYALNYIWSTGETTSRITVAPNRTTTYSVTVTGPDGCTGVGSVVVTVNSVYPTVTTSVVLDITGTTASCGGEVVSDGGSDIIARGVCWNTNSNPSVENSPHTTDGIGTGSFTSSMTDLQTGTTYYVRAYATNSRGTAYGNTLNFTTIAEIPAGDAQPCPDAQTVTDYDGNVYNTVKIGTQCWMRENVRAEHYSDGTPIPLSSAVSWNTPTRCYPNNNSSLVSTYGYLYNWPAAMNGVFTPVSLPTQVQGVCPNNWHMPSLDEWNLLTTYVASQAAFTCGDGCELKALASTTGWASTSYGCAVGNTPSLNNSTNFSALPAGYSVNGDFYSYGQWAVFWTASLYAQNYAYDVFFSYDESHSSRVGIENYDWSIEIPYGFSVRCVKNETGGVQTTPSVSTKEVSNITSTSLSCGGNVTYDGGAEITARGVCWSTSHNPTISDGSTTDGSGLGNFTSSITGLTAGTIYYIRAYATNSEGTAYGNEVVATTSNPNDSQPCPGVSEVTDYDGNTYHAVQVGGQCWLKENMRAEHYSDGSAIPLAGSSNSGYSWRYYPNGDADNVDVYGYLYTWPAAIHLETYSVDSTGDVQGVCPTGWHVPSDPEWTILDDYLSSQSNYICDGTAYKNAKAIASTSGWETDIDVCSVGNTQSNNNSTGLSIFPAGYSENNGSLYYFSYYAVLWTSTLYDGAEYAYDRMLSYDSYGISKYGVAGYNYAIDINCGLSVRCIRDVASEGAAVIPTVTTSQVTNIDSTTATAGGEVTAEGDVDIVACGVCWSTSPMPTIADDHSSEIGGLGTFTSYITSLLPNTTYYVRAYATVASGVLYGEEVSFHTTCNDVQVTITGNTTINYGEETTLTATGASSYTWSTGNTTDYITVDPSVNAEYSVIGTNEFGCFGTDSVMIQVNPVLPAVTTKELYDIGTNMAMGGGRVTFSGGDLVTSRGVCWSTSQNPTINDAHTEDLMGLGNFTSSLTGLTRYTTYYVRAYATNSAGTAYGNEMTFTTMAELPVVVTGSIDNVTINSARASGAVIDDGGTLSTIRGVCWSTEHNPTVEGSHSTNGLGLGDFYSTIMNLESATTYYVRAYATNVAGTSYGDEVELRTSFTCGLSNVKDIDGNEYNTLLLGDQCWMKQNLKTTHYSDGTYIAMGSTTSNDLALRYNPNDNSNNVANYGCLYNWPAVMHGNHSSNTNPSGVQGVCPDGWHVPSYLEWESLTNFMSLQTEYLCDNVSEFIAKALASTYGWNYSSEQCAIGNYQADNNASGFNARPAGFYGGGYSSFGSVAGFWSATLDGTNKSYYFMLGSEGAYANRGSIQNFAGFSVRCLRNAVADNPTAVVPSVTTSEVVDISFFSATVGGNVTSDGGSVVTSRGVCWSTSQNPTIEDNLMSIGAGTGVFAADLESLVVGETYYVRAFATNSAGTAYGNQEIFTTIVPAAPIDGLPCSSSPSVTDYDGNVYNTVQIGMQCWTRENMKTSHYSDGTPIETSVSKSLSVPYRYYPDNDSDKVEKFGYIYNWAATMRGATSSNATPSGVQGVCPDGWHVPSNSEWSQLADYLSDNPQFHCSYDANNLAKSLTESFGWYYSIDECDPGGPQGGNITGFSALPAGAFGTSYSIFGDYAIFWSSTSSDYQQSIVRELYYGRANLIIDDFAQNNGASVRCVNDFPTEITIAVNTANIEGLTSSSAVSGGTIENYNDLQVLSLGVCWSTSMLPTVEDAHTVDVDSLGVFESHLTNLVPGTTYFVRAYANVRGGTVYGNRISFTTPSYEGNAQPCDGNPLVIDYDGNTYNTIQIGTQCWMKENVRSEHYSDGSPIPLGNSTQNGLCRSYPADNNIGEHGYLYSWYAAMDGASSSNLTPSWVQGACPTGWHLPSDAEWDTLTNYLSAHSEYYCSSSSNIAKALASTHGWKASSVRCAVGNVLSDNNSTGFTATQAISNIGTYFWSSTEQNIYDAVYRLLIYESASVSSYYYNKSSKYSVRCLTGPGEFGNVPYVHTNLASNVTTTSAVSGGNVTNNGGSSVTARGVCWSTSQNPTLYNNHTVDGTGDGSFTSNITGLDPHTTYFVRAYATNGMGTAYGNQVAFTTSSSTTHSSIVESACESYTWIDGNTYSESGTYVYTFIDANGCAQVDTLHLTINHPTHQATTVTECESFVWNGTTYTTSGDYTYTQTDANGCTQVDTLHLTINHPTSATLTQTIVENQLPYEWNGVTFTASGIQTVTLTNVYGCDSVVTMLLIVNNNITSFICDTICESELPYDWNGVTFQTAGTQTAILTTSTGADSVVVMALNVRPTNFTNDTIYSCGSYVWNDSVYTESGDYRQTLTNVYGCDSVVTLHLTVNHATAGDTTAVACETFDWYEHTNITSSCENLTHMFVNTNGCDSVVTLHLTINNPTHVATTVTECESYVWNGTTYTTSGDYTYTQTDANGCTQVDTLHLTINHLTSATLTQTIVENQLPYEWNGVIFTTSGMQTVTLTNVYGCDSVVTMFLIVNNNITSVICDTICESELPYDWNGVTFQTAGTQTAILTTSTGADSVVVMALNVRPTNFTNDTKYSCGSYVWNGIEYTQSGDYQQTLTNVYGCDSVVTLHLTISQITTVALTQTIVENQLPYVWNGVPFYGAGSHTLTLTNEYGCDSVITMTLFVHRNTISYDERTICESELPYVWNDVVFENAGTQATTLMASTGADSLVMMTLSVNPLQHTECSVFTCDSYEWNGVEYTVSGDYSLTFTAANGCDSVVTLHLTICPPWNVAPGHYEMTMNITGQLLIDDTLQMDANDMLAAFSHGNCVGMSQPMWVGAPLNTYITFLTIYGNQWGDTIEFKMFDASENEIYEHVKVSDDQGPLMVTFESNRVYGTPTHPIRFNASKHISQSIDLASGWNWISTNVSNDDPALLAQFEDEMNNNGIMLKSQTKYYQYDSGMWFGNLTQIVNTEGYMLEANEHQMITLEGRPVDASQTMMTIAPGWNWIGYLPQSAMPLTSALSGWNAQDGEIVKSQTMYVQYVEGMGWLGNMTQMEPGKMYMLYSAHTAPVLFAYPSNVRTGSMLSEQEADYHWVSSAHQYPNNMTVTFRVEVDEVPVATDRFEVAAFSGTECLGVASLQYEPVLNEYVGYLTIHGEETAHLTFRGYDENMAVEYMPAEQTMDFAPNASIGTPVDPTWITFKSTTVTPSYDDFEVTAYPNPTNGIVTISVAQATLIGVGVYDSYGQLLRVMNFNDLQSGNSAVDLSHFAAGVYTLRVSTDRGLSVIKVVKK